MSKNNKEVVKKSVKKLKSCWSSLYKAKNSYRKIAGGEIQWPAISIFNKSPLPF